jgi:hypothetical protein
MLALSALAAGLIVSAVPTDEPPALPAPIPISGPAILTVSGTYVVMRDFTASGQPAIKLSGAVDVDIDFAGHAVTGNVILRANTTAGSPAR